MVSITSENKMTGQSLSCLCASYVFMIYSTKNVQYCALSFKNKSFLCG